MELNFLGRGAGFNPAEGCTSAYFIDKGELFLIDCGESVFRILLERKILDPVSKLNLFITHTHSDHAGSLGSLVLYASTIKKLIVNIIFDENMAFLPDIRTLLRIFGVPENMYHFVDSSKLDAVYSLFDKVRYFKTKHCNELDTCGILFETGEGLVFYSGDMSDPSPLLEVIGSERRIDKIYIDSSSDRGLHHISVHTLNDVVPAGMKPKIHCMHINNPQCAEEAKTYGFSVVSVCRL